MIESKQILLRVTIAFVLNTVNLGAVFGDEIDECIAKKQAEFENPQLFSQGGSVTCPSGDIVGFPPRSRKHNRSGTVTYTAPQGYKIQNNNINSVTIENTSSNNGTFGALQLNRDASSVSVIISCNGKSPGQGRAWQNVKIKGTIVRLPSIDDIKKWTIECVRK